MPNFVIEGGHPLNGEVTIGGSKNAAFPLLASALLTDEPITLRNVPRIRDVTDMLAILDGLGVDVRETGDHEVTLHAHSLHSQTLDALACGRIRGSVLLAGPMLARVGRVTLPLPGGDVVGRRRMDTHLLAFNALGAECSVNHGYNLTARQLRGGDILLDEASVTGTENAIMAAVLAKGTTVLRNAASEPHVQDLCHFLNRLGARIGHIGSNTLLIEGVERLHGGEFTISPDYIEVGSLIGLGAVTGGRIRIKNVVRDHLRMTELVFRRLSVELCYEGDNDLVVCDGQELAVVDDALGAIPKIDDGPWPAFPSDLMSIALVAATQARGTILIHEKMFDGRLYFVDKLIQMGARIVLCDPHRCVVVGPAQLRGEQLASPDIRAGMALVIAALCAEGQSVIGNIGQIDRGYEAIDAKLRALGAHIERTE